jgi:hypothetical protein
MYPATVLPSSLKGRAPNANISPRQMRVWMVAPKIFLLRSLILVASFRNWSIVYPHSGYLMPLASISAVL